MKNSREKASYCIGLETGKNLKQQFSDLDLNLLTQGFEDALTGNLPKLGAEEIQAVMISLRRQVEAQQREFIARVAEENKKIGEKFLSDNKSKEGVVTLNSGLQYKVVRSGQGGAHPKFMDVVAAHYKGSFIDGRVFESSYEREKPQIFPVNQVIQGWAEALQMMSVGDRWQLFIPSYLAYGEGGYGPIIGPNTTLVFEMELIAINPT